MDDTIHRSYEGFAYVYDTFMDNVPYEEWAEYVTGILEEYGITDGLVLDPPDRAALRALQILAAVREA